MSASPALSFARGAPSLDIIDVDGLRDAAARAFANDPGGMTAYGTSVGYVPLRRLDRRAPRRRRVNVLVTNGSMQADAFLFDELVWRPATGRRRAPELRPHAALAAPARRRAARRSRSSPTGSTPPRSPRCSRAARGQARPHHPQLPQPGRLHAVGPQARKLLELAREHDFTIFEDDPYVALRFRGETLPTMLSLDAGAGKNVVYASSFSKTVCPGIRVGYLIGPAELIAADRRARDEHLHLARAWSTPRSSTSSVSGALERSIANVRDALEERAARLRRRSPEIPDASLRRARRRLLPLGRSFPTASSRRTCSRPPPTHGSRSSAATTSCTDGGSGASGSPFRGDAGADPRGCDAARRRGRLARRLLISGRSAASRARAARAARPAAEVKDRQ
jgi:2-aminoadipate transaminase